MGSAEGSPLELGRAAATTMWGRYASLVVRRLYERGLDVRVQRGSRGSRDTLWLISRKGGGDAVWDAATGVWTSGQAEGDKLSGLMRHLGCTRIVRTAHDRQSHDPDQEEPRERAAA